MTRRHVMAAERLHGDNTLAPVLAKGKRAPGRLWGYVRDDRPFAGYNRLYEADRQPGAIHAALCWAHARHGFFKLADIVANTRRSKDAPPVSPLAMEAVTSTSSSISNAP